MRKSWKFGFVILAIAAAIQLVRPVKTNPPIEPRYEIQNVLYMEAKTADLLDRSCADCHSNRTVWPWYSRIAPVSWAIVHHVNEGRRELNFSQWGAYSAERRDKKLGEICKEVRKGEMPGKLYPMLHPHARLMPAEVDAICAWSDAARSAASPEAQAAP